MTREEAIKHIKDIICENNTIKHSDMVVFENEKEALRMAIQALSQEPTIQEKIQEKQAESEKYQKAFDDGYANGYEQARFDYEQEPCTDAVSREDAIRAFADMRDGYPQFHGDMIPDYMVAKILKELPSVMKKPVDCEDAVSRDAVIERLKKEDKILYTTTGLNYLIRVIEGLPSITSSRRKGYWIYEGAGYCHCSVCETSRYGTENFCPKCGTKMVESQESEE